MSLSQSTSTLSAIPDDNTPDSPDFISMVNEASKYAPYPPPDIVRKDEAGAEWERPSNHGPVTIQRRSPTYNFNEYEGGIGKYMNDNNTNTNTNNQSSINTGSSIFKRASIIIDYIITQNRKGIISWLTSYLLNNNKISLHFGIIYLTQIINNDIEYPYEIQEIIKNIINISNEYIYVYLVQISNQINLYIPKSILIPNLNLQSGNNLYVE